MKNVNIQFDVREFVANLYSYLEKSRVVPGAN